MASPSAEAEERRRWSPRAASLTEEVEMDNARMDVEPCLSTSVHSDADRLARTDAWLLPRKLA